MVTDQENFSERDPRILEARANPLTGRVLLRWNPQETSLKVQTLLLPALEEPPLSVEAVVPANPDEEHESRSSKLIGKLILGGTELVSSLRSWHLPSRPELNESSFFPINGRKEDSQQEADR